MSLLSNFFGKKESQQSLTANEKIKKPLALSVLFPSRMDIDHKALEKELRAFDGSMKSAICHPDATKRIEGYSVSLAGWGRHVIRLLGSKQPMPAEALEPCVAGAHYPKELKEKARAHQSHVLLFYVGYDASPMEQYVALASVAGVLSKFGAFIVVNESAQTSFPAAALAESSKYRMELLHTMALMYLYIGFVKHEVEGVSGIWMRTYGANLFNLPDFAFHAKSHDQGKEIMELLSNVISYLLDSKAKLLPGHTMQIDEEQFMRFRMPAADEAFLESEGELLVVELIDKSQINR